MEVKAVPALSKCLAEEKKDNVLEACISAMDIIAHKSYPPDDFSFFFDYTK